MGLGAVFREALNPGGASEAPAWADAADLEARLGALCARGREACPGLALADETFIRHLGAVLARDKAGAPSLDDRLVGDLFLAAACVAGVPGAAEAFDERCTPAIRAAV